MYVSTMGIGDEDARYCLISTAPHERQKTSLRSGTILQVGRWSGNRNDEIRHHRGITTLKAAVPGRLRICRKADFKIAFGQAFQGISIAIANDLRSGPL